MNYKSYFLFISFITIYFVVHAQISDHPWPQNSGLLSNEKYEIRARTYHPADSTFGDWVDLTEFFSVPRDYATHWKTGDDAVTGFLKDRSMTFTIFEFTGTIEVEVTQNLTSMNAISVELAPKAFGFTPHYFDGKTVRFAMDRPEYVSVNFNFGPGDTSINRAGNRANGYDIKHGCMILSEQPESQWGDGYSIPNPDDPGVVVWSNDTPLSTIRSADIIYFPAGEHHMKEHHDRWERNGSLDFEEREGNWVTTLAEYNNAQLYRGRLNLGKNGQKVYLAPGAIVYGGFHSSGNSNNWLYGTGIVTGRRHLMHEIIKPQSSNPIAIDQPYQKITQTKEAFCYFGNGARYDGITFLEAWHHTCPSGQNSVINRTKIIGWASNNDGIRPSSGSEVDRMFVKTSDDLDYARDRKTVRNAVFWPMVNGAVGMLGWNNLGSGRAEYHNTHIINAEWHLADASKGNVGIVGGGMAKAGIKLVDNVYQDMQIENRTNFLVLVKLSGTAEGYLRNFLIKNITTEYPLSNPAGVLVKQELRGSGNSWVEGWRFSNVFIDGVLLTWENHKDYFNLNLGGTNGSNVDLAARARNITFDSEGEIYTIRYSETTGGKIRPRGKNKQIQVAEGLNQQISIIPDPGYRIKTISINDELIYEHHADQNNRRLQTCTFKEIHANQKVDVTFEPGDDYFDLLPMMAFTTPPPDQEPPSVPGPIIIHETTESSLTILWGSSTDNTSVSLYEIFINGYHAATIESPDTTAFFEWLPCSSETAIQIRAVDSYGNRSEFSPVKGAMTNACTPHVIPGKIEAEKYSGKSDNIGVYTNNDGEPGHHIGGFSHGDWVEYLVNVQEAGSYAADFRVSSNAANARIRMVVNDQEIGSLFLQGPMNWSDNGIIVALEEGEQTIRLHFSGPSGLLFDLNWISILSDPTGISETGTDSSMQIFPNPFDNKIYLETDAEMEHVRLYSSSGTLLVPNISTSVKGLIIHTSHLPAGVYFLSVSGKAKKMIKRY